MAGRGFSHLPRILRKSHRLTKSWRETSKVCKVLTEDGRVNPGLAKRIALEGYIPTDDVIARLIRHGAIEPRRKQKHMPKDLWDMGTAALRKALDNRETMPPPDPRILKAFVKLGWMERTS